MPQKKPADPAVTTRAKNSSTAGAPAKGQSAIAGPESEAARQMKFYEQGIRTFNEQRLPEARALFEQALTGPLRPVAHNARLHLAICERRTQTESLQFESPEEHYNYAVERINAGDLAGARRHLLAAQKTLPQGDHVLYALAACDALSGDVPAAYENLKRAIEINPRNRLNARQDSDFAEAARNPQFQKLLQSDRPAPI